jgi:hypothetical protein
MTARDSLRTAANSALSTDDVEGVLCQRFYTEPDSRRRTAPAEEAKPTHYRVICISLYNEDLSALDGMVESLKARGLTKANRSALIRYALSRVDLDAVPRGL